MKRKRGFRPVTINIDGQPVSIGLAKITYRCEICGGELSRTGNRLHCLVATHRGLIHRDNIKERQTKQQQNINNSPYQVIDGKVVYNGH